MKFSTIFLEIKLRILWCIWIIGLWRCYFCAVLAPEIFCLQIVKGCEGLNIFKLWKKIFDVLLKTNSFQKSTRVLCDKIIMKITFDYLINKNYYLCVFNKYFAVLPTLRWVGASHWELNPNKKSNKNSH
jgi:hypothetical protein